MDIMNFETYELELFAIDTKLASGKEVKKLKYKDEYIFDKLLCKIDKKERKRLEQYYKEL